MALGVELNSIAPSLIRDSGQALVQGIRQIGQQISGHLTEIQTRRDMAAMAQELQGVNVQSNDFPVQLTQLVSRHPLAVRDERGQMALSILGKSHAQWQAGEAEARAFSRAMTMQGLRDQSATTRAEAARQAAASRTKVGNKIVDLTDPANPVTVFESDPLNPPMPFASTPQGIMDRRTGQITTPATGKDMTPYQRAQLRRAERKDRISALNQEINQFDSDIASAVRQYESSFDREGKAATAEEKARFQADKTEIGKVADQLKAEKAKRLEALRKLREEDSSDVDGEDDIGLPPVAPSAAVPAAAVKRVPVLDPNGQPMQLRADQVEAALQAGWKLRQ